MKRSTWSLAFDGPDARLGALMRTLIRSLSQIATPTGSKARRGGEMGKLHLIPNGAILIEGNRIAWLGPDSQLPGDVRKGDVEEIDGKGRTAIPGFVDSHTHLPFAGLRESEFNRRLHGESYEQIAASGGGIAATVRETRAASEEELIALVLGRCATMARHGTTTAEAKSGYGLNRPDELKQLRAIAAAGSGSPVRLVSTCLAAHEVPPEARGSADARRKYLDEVIRFIQPEAARQDLAQFCDVFVERGVYTAEEGREVLLAGAKEGLVPRIHADELSDTGGAALAVEVGAASADHLMYVSESGIRALAGSNTVANLLPATSLFLMSERFAPGRALIDAGAAVSLSTDCNPGSSMTESMQLVIQLASLRMRLTVEESLTAATLNGASSLGLAGQTGTLEPGKRADLALLDAPSFLHLVYHFGINLVSAVWRDGTRVA